MIPTIISTRRPVSVGDSNAYVNIITGLLFVWLTMVLGDALVYWQPDGIPHANWALLDAPVHAALATLVISPLLRRLPFRRQRLQGVLLAGLVVVALDLDHFIAAHSLSIHDALSMPARPISHSLLFALSCGLLAHWLIRRPGVGWLVFALLASHVVRDAASGGTPFLWPLDVYRLSVPAYYAAQIGLYLVTEWLVARKLALQLSQPAQPVPIKRNSS